MPAANKERIKQLTPTARGSTGLFNTFLPDTLRRGEFSLALGAQHLNREPGDLDFTLFPASLSLGLSDRVEWFIGWEAQRRVHADFVIADRIPPHGSPAPARLSNAAGLETFFNQTPFLDTRFASGPGELWTGIKVLLLSERSGAPLSLALQPILKLPLSRSRSRLLRGLTNGAVEGGFSFILSREMPMNSLLSLHGGPLFAGDTENVSLQHQWSYALGYQLPLASRKLQFIGELVGNAFWGRAPEFANPKAPLDLYAGVRLLPAPWWTLSLAYSATLRKIDSGSPLFGIPATDTSGWFVQLAVHRKINRPPTIQCEPARLSITEGETASIRVFLTDPDDDFLTLTWTTRQGRISSRGHSGVFESSGLDPGTYQVRAEAGDGEHTRDCSVQIEVKKRKLPPILQCGARETSVIRGESIKLRVEAMDPNRDPLSFSWRVEDRPIANDRPEFVFGTEGRSPGRYRISVTVSDSDHLQADCHFQVRVELVILQPDSP